MKHLFLLFAFLFSFAGMLSAQENFRAPRPETDPVQAQAQRFAGQVARLREAVNTGDQHNLIALESEILGGMRQEIERSEAAALPRLTRQRAIFSEFENFSFYQAKPADAQAKLVLLEEFAGTMTKQ